MRHIEKLKIVNQTYPGTSVLKLNTEFELESINLLVGNQGCGKSTILKLLSINHKDIKLSLNENTIKNGIKTFYFDSEKDNPRTKDPILYTNVSGGDKGIGFKNALLTRWESHGETLQRMIIEPLKNAENCVIFLDEPESGLSLTNQFILIKEIKNAVKRGCQFLIATHCYPLIMEFNVISLEHNKQMKGSEFIELIKNPTKINLDLLRKDIKNNKKFKIEPIKIQK